MRSLLFLSFLGCLYISCNAPASSGAATNLDGYETTTISGTNVVKAIKKNAGGDLLEEGYLFGGKKNGTWMTFWEGEHSGRIKTLASYTDGILNGPYFEFTNRSQIEKEVNYSNNQYNGKFAQYKFGRVEKEINYKDNELNGASIDYDGKGNRQMVKNYKNGKLHGKYQTFNPEGKLTLEYEYSNGEKVSGGIVENKD